MKKELVWQQNVIAVVMICCFAAAQKSGQYVTQ